MDVDLVKAAGYICNIADAKDIYFVNVIREFHMPDELLKEFPDILEKGIKERKERMEKAVKDHFECRKDPRIHYLVEKGQPTKIFMKQIEDEDMDLVMIGRKQSRKDKKGGFQNQQ